MSRIIPPAWRRITGFAGTNKGQADCSVIDDRATCLSAVGACDISAGHSLSVPIRGMDLFHVAIAIEVGADAILTFDQEQKVFAEAAGVRVLPLAVRRGR